MEVCSGRRTKLGLHCRIKLYRPRRHDDFANFLFTDNSNRVRKSLIINGNDNGAYYGNCDEYKGREKRNCKDRYTSLEAKIAFDKSRPAVSRRMGVDCKTQRRIRKEKL